MAVLKIKPARIEFYDNKTTKYSGSKVLEVTGADIVFNASLFDMSTLEPLCDVKIKGDIVSDDQYSYRGFAWNDGDERAVHAVSGATSDDGVQMPGVANYSNFVSCLMLSTAEHGKLSLSSSDLNNLSGNTKRQRTAFGYTADGKMVIFVVNTNSYTIPQVQDLMVDTYKCLDSINLDGGGSSQLYSKDNKWGTVSASRIVSNYICVWVKPPDTTAPIINYIASTQNGNGLSIGESFVFQVNLTEESNIKSAKAIFTSANNETFECTNYVYTQSLSNIVFTTDPIAEGSKSQQWTLTSLEITDDEDNTLSIDNVKDDYYIYYFIEDITSPIITNISCAQAGTFVKSGDKINIVLTLDEDSGINEAGLTFSNRTNTKVFDTRTFSYKNSTKKCTISITVDDNWQIDEYYLQELFITDAQLNTTSMNFEDLPDEERIIITIQDGQAPVITNINCNQKDGNVSINSEIITTLTVNDYSDIKSASITYYHNNYSISINEYTYDESLKTITFKTAIVDSNWPLGLYTLKNIVVIDEFDNTTTLETSTIHFSVVDKEAPLVTNITSEQVGATLTTGDIFNFTVHIQENSSIEKFIPIVHFENNEQLTYQLSDYFYDYDSQTITASIAIQEDDFPGRWILSSIQLTDSDGNTGIQNVENFNIYFYTKDESDYEAPILDFVNMPNYGRVFTSKEDSIEYVYVQYQDISPITFGQLCFKSYKGGSIVVEEFSQTNLSNVIGFAINPNKFSENVLDGFYFLETVTLSDAYDNCLIAKNQDNPDYQMGLANFQVKFQTEEPEDPEEPSIEPITISLVGEKFINGTGLEGKAFTFELLLNGEVIDTTQNETSGSLRYPFAFKDIIIGNPGEITYQVREQIDPNITHIVFDTTVYTVTIIVTEENYILTPNITIYNNKREEYTDTIRFSNSEGQPLPPSQNPDPIFVPLIGNKILLSNDMALEANQFKFNLIQNEEIIQTKFNDANGLISFDGIYFDKPDEKTFIVQEVIENIEGMTYDSMIYKIIINVTNKNNILVADTTVQDIAGNNINSISFTNTYVKPTIPDPEPPIPDEPIEPEPDIKRILIREPTFGYGSFWMKSLE